MNWNLIKPSFWFDLHAPILSAGTEKGLFLTFGLMIIVGAIVRIVARHRKDDRYVIETFKMIGHMLVVMGLVGLMLFFLTYEKIYIFGARFWYLFWGIGLIIWIAYIIRHVKVVVPPLREKRQAAGKKNKYIPKKGRR